MIADVTMGENALAGLAFLFFAAGMLCGWLGRRLKQDEEAQAQLHHHGPHGEYGIRNRGWTHVHPGGDAEHYHETVR